MGIIREELELAIDQEKIETLKLIINKNNLSDFEKVYLKNNLSKNIFIPLVDYLINKNQINNFFSEKEIEKNLSYKLDLENANYLLNIFRAFPKIFEQYLQRHGVYNIISLYKGNDINIIIKIIVEFKGWKYIISELKKSQSHSDLDRQIISAFIKRLVINFNTLTPEIFEMLQNFYAYGGIITDDFIKFCSRFNTNVPMFDVFSFYCGYKTIIKCANNESYSEDSLLIEIQNILKSKSIRVVYDALKILNLPEEYNKIIKDAINILDNTKKINTAEKNKLFNYDFIKYIYPVLGLKKSLDLLLYDSGACFSLIRLIKEGYKEEVLKYINFYERNNLFENNDKRIHYAFRSFYEYKNLIMSVINNEDKLTLKDINNLRKIILNKNWWKIESIAELKNYDRMIVNSLKKELSMKVFGYESIGALSKVILSYSLNNPYKLKKIFKVLQEHGETEFFLTKEDFELIKYLNRAEEYSFEYVRKESIERLEKGLEVDLSLELKELILKVRKAYGKYMNYSFSKITDFDKCKTYFDKGVKFIEFNGNPFSFLVHTLHNFDRTFEGYQTMLEENPDLWDKLEGATTISLSSISEKNLNFLGKQFNSKVNMLFNEFPPSDLLFMDTTDLMVDHGGHRFEPKCKHWKYTDLDSLNYAPVVNGYTYNEIVLNRKGLVPCALLVLDEYEMDDKIIRAAKHFNVPIIKVDRFLYADQKDNEYEEALIDFKKTLDIKYIEKIIYNGTDLHEDVYDLLEFLQEKRLTNEIDSFTHTKILLEMQRILNLIDGYNLETEKNMKVWKLNVILNNLYPAGKLSFVDDMRGMILNDGEKTYVVDIPADYEMDRIKTLVSFNMIREKIGLKHNGWTTFFSKSIVAKPLAYTEYRAVCKKNLKKDYILKDVIKEALLEKIFLELKPFNAFLSFQNNLFINGECVNDEHIYEVKNSLEDYIKKDRKTICEVLDILLNISDSEWEAILKNLVAYNEISYYIYQIKAKIDGWVTIVSNLDSEKLALTKK